MGVGAGGSGCLAADRPSSLPTGGPVGRNRRMRVTCWGQRSGRSHALATARPQNRQPPEGSLEADPRLDDSVTPGPADCEPGFRDRSRPIGSTELLDGDRIKRRGSRSLRCPLLTCKSFPFSHTKPKDKCGSDLGGVPRIVRNRTARKALKVLRDRAAECLCCHRV